MYLASKSRFLRVGISSLVKKHPTHKMRLPKNTYCNNSHMRHEVGFKSPNSTFVSSYYRIDEHQIYTFLERKNIEYKITSDRNQITIKECPFCHDTKGHTSNQHKLYIYKDNGRYYCFRCGSQGSWYDNTFSPYLYADLVIGLIFKND